MTRLKIADFISSLRILAFPILLYLLFASKMNLFGWVFFFASITDLVDGLVARNIEKPSKRGQFLDSTGDLLMYLAGFIGLVWFFPDEVLEKWYYLALGLVPQIVQIITALIRFRTITTFHTTLAKISGLTLAAFLCWTFIVGFPLYLLELSMILLFADGVEETYLTLKAQSPDEEPHVMEKESN